MEIDADVGHYIGVQLRQAEFLSRTVLMELDSISNNLCTAELTKWKHPAWRNYQVTWGLPSPYIVLKFSTCFVESHAMASVRSRIQQVPLQKPMLSSLPIACAAAFPPHIPARRHVHVWPRTCPKSRGTFKHALLQKYGDMVTAWFQCIDVKREGRIQESCKLRFVASCRIILCMILSTQASGVL